jgi:integrase
MTQLTALRVDSLSQPGRYADGNGLYLEIDKAGNKRWLFRYQFNKKRTNLGLDSYDKKSNSLAQARRKALECKRLLANGIDPRKEKLRLEQDQRKQEELALQTEESKALTFEKVATEWFERKQHEWSNPKHRQQNWNTLKQYAFPHMGKTPVSEIELNHIKSCLDPIWYTKTETATRVRGRIESVISFAIASGYRTAPSPAIWRGFLDQMYPQPTKLMKNRHQEEGVSGHHAALPYKLLPDFYRKLRSQQGIGALALRFCICTVSRTAPVRFAKWEEIDFESKVWTVPAQNMKGRESFRVALSDEALLILNQMPEADEYVFPGGKKGKPLSDGGMRSVLKRMQVADATVHGFRSTFRDYIGEGTQMNPIVAEYCLAHKVGDATERAYARGDMLEKRFHMMNIWADYVTSKVMHGPTAT